MMAHEPITPVVRARDVRSAARPSAVQSGLTFDVARAPEDVSDAWACVYAQYVAQNLIGPSADRLHVVPQAVGPETVVVLGRISGLTVSTATVVAHADRPVPADRVFAEEIRKLRGTCGRRLVDVELFADRRSSDIDRTFSAVLELMRFAIHFSLYSGGNGMLCCVPAERARLFGRAFGFEQYGTTRTVPTFGGDAVALMHATMPDLLANRSESRTLSHVLENPVLPEVFDARYRFDAESLEGTNLGGAVARSMPEMPSRAMGRAGTAPGNEVAR